MHTGEIGSIRSLTTSYVSLELIIGIEEGVLSLMR